MNEKKKKITGMTVMQLAAAHPIAKAPVTPEYKGFPTIFDWLVTNHGSEVQGVMEAHGLSGHPQPIKVAQLYKQNPGFADDLANLIDLLKSAHGYDGREQFDGYDSFDAWRDSFDELRGKKVDPYAKGLPGNDSSKKRRSTGDLLAIIEKGVSIAGSAGNAAADIAAKIKGMKGGGAPDLSAQPDGAGHSGDGFFAKYKMYIIGAVVLVGVGIAAVFLIKKK